MSANTFYGWTLALASVCALLGSPASSQGGLGLEEVLEAIKSEPRLVGQIEVELRRRDLKAAGIVCNAGRHGSQWRFLVGGNAAPYACTIGDRTLRIEADRIYFDINGRKLGQLGQTPEKLLFDRAKSFRETHIRWTWTP